MAMTLMAGGVGRISEEAVVRKTIPSPDPHEGERVMSDGDLVVWTGHRGGIVATKVEASGTMR